ncbi:fibrous sheath CABYR-binding protein-like [Scylla paramamosain]|uniref:fibrous sheath CABYR-binding protein-like n=1 Tax=Scylla paramamosain TaxID=85552 RepID=UPI003083DBD7
MPQKMPVEMSQKSTIKKRATPLDFGSTAAPTPAQKPLKKMKKQRATLAPEDKPAPTQDQAAMQLAPRDQPSPAWESPEDESPSGSDDREEPPSAMDGPEVQLPPARHLVTSRKKTPPLTILPPSSPKPLASAVASPRRPGRTSN